LLFALAAEVMLIEFGGEHLDRHDPIQPDLGAAEYHAEAATADFFGALKPVRTKVGSKRAADVSLHRKRLSTAETACTVELI
jgi:hypothetical protein